ncbi:MAG: hypothetical protein WBZ15_16205 [Mycobacterium sp.]|jgi:hypothetical protein|uniref:hypothetical protein n=1 Tax=Mycobacterium sp. TaxID=1785 RepID=UPI003C45E3E1
MVVQRRDRGGLAINWGGELLALSRSEIGRLLAFIDGRHPMQARMLRHPVKADDDV